MKELLEASGEEELDDVNAIDQMALDGVPGFQRDTISSFTNRVIAMGTVKKAFDERHVEQIYKPCRNPFPNDFLKAEFMKELR